MAVTSEVPGVMPVLWILTGGIFIILFALAITVILLVHYKRAGYKTYFEFYENRWKEGWRGSDTFTVTGRDYIGGWDDMAFQVPPIPGRRSTPLNGYQPSPSHSINDHIYDIPAEFLTLQKEAPSVASSISSAYTSPYTSASGTPSYRSSSFEPDLAY